MSPGLGDREQLENGKRESHGFLVRAREQARSLFERVRHPSYRLARRAALPKREVTRDEVSMDIGSGTGRLALRAAEYPFDVRLVGIELSDQLNEVAKRNLGRHRGRLTAQDIERTAGDPLEQDFPMWPQAA